MGNRAVITASKALDVSGASDIGVYLHWNGGRDSVEAFLKYCELKGYRPPDRDNYGWARLCQVIGNFFGGSDSIGIGKCSCLDCDNFDNGVYIIEGWRIVDRKYNRCEEQDYHDLLDMLTDINDSQPAKEKLPDKTLAKALDTTKDKDLQALWMIFGDIPMDPETECMEGDFLDFPAGTHREEIWRWFDERHSKGVAYLVNGGSE